ncbi:MAG: RNA pyrophosphohydrolase [Proteobacteria bacterium]|nr:RNA pyrophosphohydrolase [Pseudomonadota bacterium]
MKLDVPPRFYRPNVGLMLIGPGRRVFIGRRLNQPDAWQMPQGGVDKGEAPVEAACRELGEEVGTTKALLLRESRDWVTYDVPPAMHPPHWKGRWKGQAQKWFALAFTGSDSDIDITAHDQEFAAWRWAEANELLGLIVDWKRPAYEAVLREFSDLVS